MLRLRNFLLSPSFDCASIAAADAVAAASADTASADAASADAAAMVHCKTMARGAERGSATMQVM